MYLMLVVQFGSFLDPLAIMLSLPLSLIGVMLALLSPGDTLNIMSMIGVILLMGIVAKNAILLIDFAKWARGSGHAAARGADRGRPRPPAADPDDHLRADRRHDPGRARRAARARDFRAPLGRAVIGGVITSTLLTLLVIPTFYEILAELARRPGRLDNGAAARHQPPRRAPPPPLITDREEKIGVGSVDLARLR